MTDATEVPDVPKDQRYELVDMGRNGTMRMETAPWAERLRYLFRTHVRHLEPQLGWKGPCEASVPLEVAADVREAMDFMGALVDHEAPAGDEKHVLLHSEGYYFHIGA